MSQPRVLRVKAVIAVLLRMHKEVFLSHGAPAEVIDGIERESGCAHIVRH